QVHNNESQAIHPFKDFSIGTTAIESSICGYLKAGSNARKGVILRRRGPHSTSLLHHVWGQ
ncbi:hypothetical protein, partial [Bradyrhizobium zhanjiangense]|uniref:hypothetical protein n=1 Tax=Bradyrhizobium zhanjiangense TaxID=1325107 RepID=UPI0019D7098C